jgi:hypothetical protein
MDLYRGSCHCGAVRFAFRSEPITTGVRCNCSICMRVGIIGSSRYFPPEDFESLEGKDALTLYQWGDRVVEFWFCKSCGVHTFHGGEKRDHLRVNLGCVEGVDPLALEVQLIDGKSF